GRQAHRLAASVVSAPHRREQKGCDTSAYQGAPKLAGHYCTVPRGRVAVMPSAHSTAVRVAILRLSDAAHTQNPLARCESRRTKICICSCPAAFTLLGDSSAPWSTSTWSPDSAATSSSSCTDCSSSM